MPNGDTTSIDVDSREEDLKEKLREHLHSLGFTKAEKGVLQAPGNTKEAIRSLHSAQREERLSANEKFVSLTGRKLMKFLRPGRILIRKKFHRSSSVFHRERNKVSSFGLHLCRGLFPFRTGLVGVSVTLSGMRIMGS